MFLLDITHFNKYQLISIQSRLFNILLKVINKKTLLKRRFSYKKIDIFKRTEPTKRISANYLTDKYRIHEHKVFTLNAGNSENRKHILYLHGGAYVEGFIKPHWDFLYMLIKNLNCTITAPDYPLAPEHTYEQTFNMLSEVYRQIIKDVKPENFILMGDSSGGGLALALAQLMRNKNIAQPDRIILLSPWLDIGLTNPDIKDVDPSDLFLGVEGLQLAGKAYAGDTSTDYYLLSPINGPLDKLGKISVFVGSREILVADARKLKSIAEGQGIDLNYREYEGMFHAWMLLNLPESKEVRKEIIQLIQNS